MAVFFSGNISGHTIGLNEQSAKMTDYNGNIDLEEVELSIEEETMPDLSSHNQHSTEQHAKYPMGRYTKTNSRSRRIGKLLRSLTDLQLVTSVDTVSATPPATPDKTRRSKSTDKPPSKKLIKTRKAKSATEFDGLKLLQVHVNNNNMQTPGDTDKNDDLYATTNRQALADTCQQPIVDISGQTCGSRFPWLRDVAVQVQCDEYMISQTIDSRRTR